jgi:hypothetical protein
MVEMSMEAHQSPSVFESSLRIGSSVVVAKLMHSHITAVLSFLSSNLKFGLYQVRKNVLVKLLNPSEELTSYNDGAGSLLLMSRIRFGESMLRIP